MHSLAADVARRVTHTSVKFPVSDGRAIEHVDLYEVVAFKFASGRDCARARTNPLDRGSLISLIQLFLYSPHLFFPLSPLSLSRRKEEKGFCHFFFVPISGSSSFSSLHFLHFLADLLSRSSLCPIDLETLMISHRHPRSDISSYGTIELFNPRFLVRSATRDICFHYLGHGTSRRG